MSARFATVIADSGIGGAERDLSELLRRIDRSRYTPAGVIVLKEKRELGREWESLGIPVTALGMKRLPMPWLIARARAEIDAWRPDILHCHNFNPIQLGRYLRARGAPYKLVSSPHINLAKHAPALAAIDRWTRRWDDLMVVESEATRRSLLAAGADSAKLSVAVNGVDTDKFRPNLEGRRRVRAQWDVAEGELLFGAMGRLHRQKGFDVLIESAARVGAELGKRPRLAIVGAGPEGAALRRLAEARGVPVIFAGLRPDNVDVLSAFDVFVQSSRYEGLSIVLLEAMSMGLPCLATDVDGTRDVAKDGENVLLVRPEDPLALAIGIGHLIEKPALRSRLSENARFTSLNFSAGKMVAAFERAYDAVLAPRT